MDPNEKWMNIGLSTKLTIGSGWKMDEHWIGHKVDNWIRLKNGRTLDWEQSYQFDPSEKWMSIGLSTNSTIGSGPGERDNYWTLHGRTSASIVLVQAWNLVYFCAHTFAKDLILFIIITSTAHILVAASLGSSCQLERYGQTHPSGLSQLSLKRYLKKILRHFKKILRNLKKIKRDLKKIAKDIKNMSSSCQLERYDQTHPSGLSQLSLTSKKY